MALEPTPDFVWDRLDNMLLSTNLASRYGAISVAEAMGPKAKRLEGTLRRVVRQIAVVAPYDAYSARAYKSLIEVMAPLDEERAQNLIDELIHLYEKKGCVFLLRPLAELLIERENYTSALRYIKMYQLDMDGGVDYDIQLWLQMVCQKELGMYADALETLSNLRSSSGRLEAEAPSRNKLTRSIIYGNAYKDDLTWGDLIRRAETEIRKRQRPEGRERTAH